MKKMMEVGRRPSGEYDGEIKFFLETNKINVWGCSSVGRASVLQAGRYVGYADACVVQFIT